MSAAAIVAAADDFGTSALRIGQMGLADLLADGDDNALPADHGAEAKREATTIFTQVGMNFVAAVERAFVAR